MAESSLPWFGQVTGDAGPYSHDTWRDVWNYRDHASILNASIFPLSEPLSTTTYGPLSVRQHTVLGKQVEVGPGSALVNGTYYRNTATLTVAIAANSSGQPRIDTIILERNELAQTVRIDVLQGTPAATPEPAALTQSGSVYQIAIADITLADGYTNVTDSLISHRQDFIGIDHVFSSNLYNWSADPIPPGSVLVWDFANPQGVKLCSADGEYDIAGVAVGYTPAASGGVPAACRVLHKGLAWVRTFATSVGDVLFASSTDGVATVGFGVGGVVGQVLRDSASGPYSLVDVDIKYGVRRSRFASDSFTATVSSVTFAQINASLNRTLLCRGGYPVMIHLAGVLDSPGGTAGREGALSVLIDGTTLLGHATSGLVQTQEELIVDLITFWTPSDPAQALHTFVPVLKRPGPENVTFGVTGSGAVEQFRYVEFEVIEMAPS